MLLSHFNQSTEQDVADLLQHCVHIHRWAEEILSKRLFSNKDELLAFAEQRARTWTWDEILSALNTHPRIGEKKAKAVLSAQEQQFSDREQASLETDQETQEAIYEGNVAYEKKYGFIFLIKAFGLNSEQILTALKYRLANDPEIEKRIVHQQLLEIAMLRLTQEIEA